MSGVWFYNLTPVLVYCYKIWWFGDTNAKMDFVWKCWYPFDKHKPLNHAFVYIFEMFSGKYLDTHVVGTILVNYFVGINIRQVKN